MKEREKRKKIFFLLVFLSFLVLSFFYFLEMKILLSRVSLKENLKMFNPPVKGLLEEFKEKTFSKIKKFKENLPSVYEREP